MSLQITCERSSQLILLDNMKLLPTYNEQILQCLSVHLNSPFACIKSLVSVLNLVLCKNGLIFLVAFELKLCYYF